MLLDSMAPEEMREVAMVFENAAQSCGQLLRSIYNATLGPSVNKTIKELFSKHVNQMPFVFHGNMHDLSYFWKSPTLPLKDINALPPELQTAVLKTMNAAHQNGLLLYTDGSFQITEQGHRYIHDLDYISNVVHTDHDLSQKMVDLMEQNAPQQPSRFVPRSAAQGAGQATMQSTGQATTQGAAQGTTQAATQGAAQATTQGAAQGTTQAAGQIAAQGAGHAAAQGAAQATTQAATQAATQAVTLTTGAATTATTTTAAGAATAGVGTIAGGAIGLAASAGQQVVCAVADVLKKTVNTIISR